MTDQAPGSTSAPEAVKKTRKSGGKKGRVITFVYTDDAGKLKLSRSKTNAFSVDKAWKDVVEAEKLANCKKVMALQGLVHEVEGNQLRKPTYDELAEMAGLTKVAK